MTAPSATAVNEKSARVQPARSGTIARFWGSSIGKKAVMAVTGLIMIAFLIAHVLGNLQMFAGPLKINEYSAALHRLGPLLWLARGGLIVALVLLAFIVLHLLHLTFGTIHPAFDRKDVYGNMIVAFQVWWVALVYLLAMI